MIQVSEAQFDELINQALESLPGEHVKQISNVAILQQEDPTDEQRVKLELRDGQTLFGLYEGVPLAMRQGVQPLLPDKITLFRGPMSRYTQTLGELKEEIRHTLWHEIGHYYGLDHSQIAELE